VYADGYHADNVVSSDGTDTYSGFSGRFFPQAGARWSLPLVRDDSDFQQVIEPVVEGIIAPNFGNSDKIPNEDSQDVELDETNILSRNRLPGLDQIEEGPRFNYGVRWSLFSGEKTQARVFVGQTYSFLRTKTSGKEPALTKTFRTSSAP
jgi:LPS-assembly protein